MYHGGWKPKFQNWVLAREQRCFETRILLNEIINYGHRCDLHIFQVKYAFLNVARRANFVEKLSYSAVRERQTV